MVILLPKASAEKRTNEQPIGKISSFTPRDKLYDADQHWGKDVTIASGT